MATLPSSRQFLTSLINTLTTSISSSSTTQPQPQPKSHPNPQTHHQPINQHPDTTENPLKSISQQQKALLATMHVVFPPPMLLQALDLLDRGLVVRVVERVDGKDVGEGGCVGGGGDENVGGNADGDVNRDERVGKEGGGGKSQAVLPPEANIHLSEQQTSSSQHHQEQEEQEGSSPPWPSVSPPRSSPSPTPRHTKPPKSKPKSKPNQIHQVRSSQAPKSRFARPGSSSGVSGGGGSGGAGTVYTVRLEAWNCSCAAFAFATFPASASSFYTGVGTGLSSAPWDVASLDERDLGSEGVRLRNERREERRDREEEEEEEWEFGGLSLSLDEGKENVPMCKHLLACLLGERWGEVLGRYVRVREVGREEMAGLGCEG